MNSELIEVLIALSCAALASCWGALLFLHRNRHDMDGCCKQRLALLEIDAILATLFITATLYSCWPQLESHGNILYMIFMPTGTVGIIQIYSVFILRMALPCAAMFMVATGMCVLCVGVLLVIAGAQSVH